MNQIPSIDQPTRASGRFGRLSYLAWLFITTLIFFAIIAALVAFLGLGSDPQQLKQLPTIPLVIFGVLYLLFIYFSIVFMIRRLHDRDHSGWLALLMLVPFVNVIFAFYVLLAPGTDGPNKFGPVRATPGWEKICGWLYIILPIIVALLFMLVLPGNLDQLPSEEHQYLEQLENTYPVGSSVERE